MLNVIIKHFKKFMIFLFSALFFTIIRYEYPIIIKGPKKYAKYQIKNVGFKDSFINNNEGIYEIPFSDFR